LKNKLESCIIKSENKKEGRKMETKFYIISKIEGEYATLTDETGGEELFIAMALLPFGADINDRLKYENFEFEIVV
jgi:hypothetical protein